MAAPNAQPFGDRPGPAAPHVHSPYDGKKSSAGGHVNPPGGHSGVSGSRAPHGTPKPVGNGKKNPLR
jgi:hypothetical protein